MSQETMIKIEEEIQRVKKLLLLQINDISLYVNMEKNVLSKLDDIC